MSITPNQPAPSEAPETAAAIRELTDRIATPAQQGESYMQRRAHLATAARQATELVLADTPSPTGNEESDRLEEWEPLVPDLTDLL